jgi:hypothetical protein
MTDSRTGWLIRVSGMMVAQWGMEGCALTVDITGVMLRGLKRLDALQPRPLQKYGSGGGHSYFHLLVPAGSVVDWEKGSMSRLNFVAGQR